MAEKKTTTTVTTNTSTRTNQQLVVDTSTSSYNLGNYVTDVTVQPYIAATRVGFFAYNLRPSTLLHIFFNSINVDQYCAPGAVNLNNIDTSTSNSVIQIANVGSPIYSDSNGYTAGVFYIPDGTFKTGTLSFEICDRADIVHGNTSVTTSAFASFTASDISVSTQGITLTTVNPQLSVANVVNTTVSVNTVVNTVVIPDKTKYVYEVNQGYDPLAQLFQYSTSDGAVGSFLAGFNLYFFQKSLTNANNGFTFYVCETLNGYPDTSTILPFSTTHVPGQSILTSNDASIPTPVMFESLVFTNADTNYAFVVKPDQSDPDILIYMAKLGDTDIKSGYQVFSQPNIGTACIGATTSGWTILQSEYVKFDALRASFNSLLSNAVFNNADRDNLSIYNISYSNNTLSIQPGDIVYGANGTSFQYSNTSKTGVVNYFNINSGLLFVDGSTGNFSNVGYVQIHRYSNTAVTSPNANSLIASASLANVYNIRTNTFVPQVSSISPPGTQIRWNASFTSNTFARDANTYPVSIDVSNQFYDYERLVASKTTENNSMSGAKSLTLNASLITDSSYLSPLIDTVRCTSLNIQNLIDPLSFNLYDEMYNYGAAKSKYLSLPVTLASGQDAQNLQIQISAYKPPTAAIKVFVKFLNGEDNDSLINKTWTPFVSDGENYFSDFSNPSDYININYYIPKGYFASQPAGLISANSTNNTVYGNNTTFTTDLAVGRWISTLNNASQQIQSITNNTVLTLNSPFTNPVSSNAYFIVTPPTCPWFGSNTNISLPGTVNATTNSNIITGNGTNFSSSFSPGSIIGFAGDEQVVISVSNNTTLSVGTPWSSNVSNANVSLVSFSGINYLNSNNNLYTSFNQFQIKIVLLSDDDSKIPIMKSVSAIALQS